MKNLITLLLGFFFIITPASAAEALLPPEQILQHIDAVRAPGDNFAFSVDVALLNKPTATPNTYEVWVRETTKSLVVFRQPIKQRGRVLLMDGPDMWIFIPGTSRALRISPQQQLVGGASHADIARVVFSLDYTATEVNQIDDSGQKVIQLKLKSKVSTTPYRTITLYSNMQYEPIKAEFYSLSGKLLRTAYYENYTEVLGKRRPMSVRMISAITDTENVRLNYTDMKEKTTPAAYYQPSYLMQIR